MLGDGRGWPGAGGLGFLPRMIAE